MSRALGDGTLIGGPNKPGFGGRGAFVFGESLEPELAALPLWLRAADVVIDVGANSGVYALRAARIVGPEGLVIALEPSVEMLSVLQRNVRRNGYENVRLRGIGAGDSITALPLYENNSAPNSFSVVHQAEMAASSSILIVTLDALVNWENLTHVDFIKIDAEGFERQVLTGASDLIARFQPALLMESSGNSSKSLAVPPGYRVFVPAAGKQRKELWLPAAHRLSPGMAGAGWANVRGDT